MGKVVRKPEIPAVPGIPYRQIHLTQGYVTLVDHEDYEWLSQYTWSAHRQGDHIYAVRKGPNNTKIRMHRDILGLKDCVVGDHIDGDTLDNQRCNLRRATRKQNSRNRAKSKSNTSGIKGVCASRGRWLAHIRVDGKRVFLGRHDTKEKAQAAYLAAAETYFGEFASLR